MLKKRNEYLDAVKGIAIILVVIGHCIQFGSGQMVYTSSIFYSNFVFKFIYSFHMPLFMLISGYLFYLSIQRPAFEIIKNKSRGLLLPLLSWNTLALCIMMATGLCTPSLTLLHTYFHTLWFLRALFFCCMLTLLVNRIFNDNVFVYIFICIFLLYIPNSIIANVFVFNTPFFILGYCFNQYELNKNNYLINSNKNILFGIISIVFFILLLFYRKEYSVYISGSYLLNESYSVSHMVFFTLYRTLTALAGCSFVLLLLWSVNTYLPQRIKHILTICSQASLCIYIVNHYLNDTLLISLPICGINYFYTIAETSMIIFLSICLFSLFKREAALKFFFLGGR